MLITPLRLRVLLDQAKQKILQHFECSTWEDLRQDQTIQHLAEARHRISETGQYSKVSLPRSHSISSLL
ncbi:hypothetical protein PILCRDRAFT_617674 [Piloderma croceum F 1598]|uniref:Uncharacterized protein n=1 Tax=Piloderma croceum (strain F 1598) TaxID=765440 RepID=A0A0C3BJJ6_PILCF|nr:hypothetical protein PILCRDRAFT_617674 [Piloderma croceum F 1598]